MAESPNFTEVERRDHPRKSLRGSAQLLIPNYQPLTVRLANLSVSGIGVVAPANLPLKLICQIQFSLPGKSSGKSSIEAKAIVVQTIFSHKEDGFKVGLQFMGLPAKTKSLFEQFLSD